MAKMRWSGGRKMALAATSSAALLLAGTTALAAGPASAATKSSSGSSGGSSKIVYQVHPIAVKSPVGAPRGKSPSQGLGMGMWPYQPGQCVALFGLACYTPAVFHTAYSIPWTINGEWAGTGESVAIIDAYGSPTVASDLATFDAEFGLPTANLHVYYPLGKPTYNPRQHHGETGWAEETSLDVQTVHDLAPGARINLIVAPNNAGNALNLAEKFAVDNHLGVAMTMSFGTPEAAFRGNNAQMMQSEAIYQQAAADGISVFASSADSGATNGSYSTPNASFPASSPYVTAAGGTDLFVGADASLADTNFASTVASVPSLSSTELADLLAMYSSTDYAYSNETAWADFNSSTCPFGCIDGPFGATGGAPSAVFPAPSWQKGLTSWDSAAMAAGDTNMMRTTSDVAFNASVYTGSMIYLGFLGANDGFYFFGGTSEASPSWAAITADLDQARAAESTPQGTLGLMGPVLYGLASTTSTYMADFNNVTVGTNNYKSEPGFSAGTGYNLPTGLGTPIVSGLLNSLAPGVSTSMMAPSSMMAP